MTTESAPAPKSGVAEDVQQCLKIDELGAGMSVGGLQRAKYLVTDVVREFLVCPELVEPRQQVFPVPIAVDDQVEFDIGFLRQSEAVQCEVRAAEESVRAAAVINVDQLTVEKP